MNPKTRLGIKIKIVRNAYMKLLKTIKKFSHSINQNIYASCLSVLIQITFIGYLDYLSGYKLGFSLFYLLPICVIAWVNTRKTGIIFSFYAAIVWVISDIISRGFDFSPFIEAWNGLIRLGFFLIFVFVLQKLKIALEQEKRLSRTDYLTGLSNSQHFFERLSIEIYKSRRYQREFTIAYMDCDNFKQINDQYGHPKGDALLKIIAQTLAGGTRVSDTTARIGGDEFAILLSETGAATSGETIKRLREKLLQKMDENHWPVTFSIGVATFEIAPDTAEKAIKSADELMYVAKRKGKNRIIQKTIH